MPSGSPLKFTTVHPYAAMAARSALLMLDKVTRAKAEADAKGVLGWTVKIALNTGPAVVGNVGAPGRFAYTAVGEAVNIAARFESLTGEYSCPIVVGPMTAAAITERFIVCELDLVRVRGWHGPPISVYELIAERAVADLTEAKYPAQYQTALERYRAGDWAGAEQYWRDEVKYPHPRGDINTSPPLVMARRCAELRARPPTVWDGIWPPENR
jgi:adenylate cyclase